MEQMLHYIEPAQLARINDLQLLARIVVNGFMTGLHRSPYSGSSIEFAQYRPYTHGDDPRFVDWKLFGRTDRLHIKQFQEETNLRCTLALDCSASMGYGSRDVTKIHYAQMLTACLATILFNQKDGVGLCCRVGRTDQAGAIDNQYRIRQRIHDRCHIDRRRHVFKRGRRHAATRPGTKAVRIASRTRSASASVSTWLRKRPGSGSASA